jgi:hypothetical protein
MKNEQEQSNSAPTTFYPDERFWIVFFGFWAGIWGLIVLVTSIQGDLELELRQTAVLLFFFLWFVTLIKYTYVRFSRDYVETRSNFFFYRRSISPHSIISIDIGGSVHIPYIVVRYRNDEGELKFPIGFFEPNNVVVNIVHEFKIRNPDIEILEGLRDYLKKRVEKDKAISSGRHGDMGT